MRWRRGRKVRDGDSDRNERLLHWSDAEVDVLLRTAQKVRAQPLGEALHLIRRGHISVLLEEVVEGGEGGGIQ